MPRLHCILQHNQLVIANATKFKRKAHRLRRNCCAILPSVNDDEVIAKPCHLDKIATPFAIIARQYEFHIITHDFGELPHELIRRYFLYFVFFIHGGQDVALNRKSVNG